MSYKADPLTTPIHANYYKGMGRAVVGYITPLHLYWNSDHFEKHLWCFVQGSGVSRVGTRSSMIRVARVIYGRNRLLKDVEI